jgi:DNA modification methylase
MLIVSGEATVTELPASIVYAPKPARSEKHPTTKPVSLITKQLVNNARRNDIVADAFGGSGSTMIAAEVCGMAARLMELDPRFTDVQCQRYFDYTGRVPVNANTGEPFPVVREQEDAA